MIIITTETKQKKRETVHSKLTKHSIYTLNTANALCSDTMNNPHSNYRGCVRWNTTHGEGRGVEIQHNYGQSRIFPDKNAKALWFF